MVKLVIAIKASYSYNSYNYNSYIYWVALLVQCYLFSGGAIVAYVFLRVTGHFLKHHFRPAGQTWVLTCWNKVWVRHQTSTKQA